MSNRFTRRDWMKVTGAAALGAAALRTPIAAQDGPESGPRFLIVITGSGGASVIDGPLAIRRSESANASTINCFADGEVSNVEGSPFRAVDLRRPSIGQIPIPMASSQSDFVRRHASDMMVATWTRTSVNHSIGQRRAVTGNEAWRGRTMQEVIAATYGESFPLPNVHLSTGTGVTDRGTDDTLPPWAFGETVTDPVLWPLGLDGTKGLARPIRPSLLAKARALRNDRLDPESTFARVFGRSERLRHFDEIRRAPLAAIESRGLIDDLVFLADSERYPLSSFGLRESPSAAAVREAFPNLATDPLDAQAALAFLLLKSRVSVTVTLGPSFDVVLRDGVDYGGSDFVEGDMRNTPIGFDFSHNAHRATQALMWDRVYRVVGKLIDLLKAEEWADGESFWDRSLVYLASDFGRSKTRPENAEEWSSGHDLNDGVLVVSPLANTNRVLGGVDPNTALTYGFDPETGEPDVGRHMEEREIFAGVLHALGVDTTGSGLPDMRAMRR
jgi:hypothetical protein